MNREHSPLRGGPRLGSFTVDDHALPREGIAAQAVALCPHHFHSRQTVKSGFVNTTPFYAIYRGKSRRSRTHTS
jgi:hypothetical protein